MSDNEGHHGERVIEEIRSLPLPPGWARTRVGEAGEVRLGRQRSPKNRSADFPTKYIRAANITWTGLELSDVLDMEFRPEERASYRLQPGDVLLSEASGSAGEVGKPAIWSGELEDCCFQNTVIRFRPKKAVKSKFALLAFQHFARNSVFARVARGVGIHHLSADRFASMPFLLPPEQEQERIVAKAEELLSDLDAGVAALERAKANLKRYRATVLKAAGEGKLTEEWRAKHPDSEPASRLLERILTERRQKWEADQITNFAAAGKEPPKNWKEKYREPMPPDTGELPHIPVSWTWATLDAVADVVGGITKDQKKANKPGMRDVPYLRVANVQRGVLDLSEIKSISASKAEIDELRLEQGDVLFTEGGDRDKLGRGWVWSGELDECIHQNHIFRCRLLSKEMQPNLVSHHGNTFGKEWFTKAGKQTTNLASINLGILRRFPIPIPPTAEQVEIVELLEERLSQIDAAEIEIDRTLLRADRLRQSILKQAFEGKLVPQDPTDDPIPESLLTILRGQDGVGTSPKKKREVPSHEADPGRGMTMDAKLRATLERFLPGQRQAIRLHSLQFDGQFRSLSPVNLEFHRCYRPEVPVSPLCLVGLNGSGKSNLIELLAVVLCDLELSLIGYSKVPQAIRLMKGPPFHLSFSIAPRKGKTDGILHVTRTAPPEAACEVYPRTRRDYLRYR